MQPTIKEIMEFISENDVKFIRLAFCDLFGTQKNISIVPEELERAFHFGVSFDAAAIAGFTDVVHSDLLLFPELDTMTILPWRPKQGRVIRFFCQIANPDKTPFNRDARWILEKMVEKARKKGFCIKVGMECEFYLFHMDEYQRATKEPFDRGGYLDIYPIDKGENIRREICLTLEEMGIYPESSHHEQGPGQNEIDFQFADACTSADQLITFKSVVKSISARNGLFASFLPKPLENKSGSGMHINLSIEEKGRNIVKGEDNQLTKVAQYFISGILRRIREITAFLNPLSNSYERLGRLEAPRYVSWSPQNRSQLIRIPVSVKDRARIELRSPDPIANPYLALALLIGAGLEGIEEKLVLQEPKNCNMYEIPKEMQKDMESLPTTLEEAIELAKISIFVKECIGEEAASRYLEYKEKEVIHEPFQLY